MRVPGVGDGVDPHCRADFHVVGGGDPGAEPERPCGVHGHADQGAENDAGREPFRRSGVRSFCNAARGAVGPAIRGHPGGGSRRTERKPARGPHGSASQAAPCIRGVGLLRGAAGGPDVDADRQLDDIGPVSYTHLDVYKRQRLTRRAHSRNHRQWRHLPSARPRLTPPSTHGTSRRDS